LTWLITFWICFKLPPWLDLPMAWLNAIMPARVFVMAVLIGWLGFAAIDLLLALYTNSELLRPHRSLGDMIVPVCVRFLKGAVLLIVLTYVVYQVGRGESLTRLFTGLGAAGLAASLAAQDILKSFFGTLLLIGERSFKLGDQIRVDGHEGTVEQVGFRSTRLRTADGSLITVPNSTIASASIANQEGQGPRRQLVTLALGKDMPVEQIAALRDRLHGWLLDHPAIDADLTDVTVGLRPESGAELQVQFGLRDAPGVDEAKVRQEITYAVLQVVQTPERATAPGRILASRVA
jgi:MscS family membrane protein